VAVDKGTGNTVPGHLWWETATQTEERKKISDLIRRRPRALDSVERAVLLMLYALDGTSRRESAAGVAAKLDLPETAVKALERTALGKIFYRHHERKPRNTPRPR
jgi:hypothetical protein